MKLVTPQATFRFAPQSREILVVELEQPNRPWLARMELRCVMRSGSEQAVSVDAVYVESQGVAGVPIFFHGHLPEVELRFEGRWTIYPDSGLARLELTIHNPGRAAHFGGYWDLGDPGSRYLKELTLVINTNCQPDAATWLLIAPGHDARRGENASLHLHQESSGGPNWHRANHLDFRGGQTPRYRGFKGHFGEEHFAGDRASPVVAIEWNGRSVACSMPEFWQRFPAGIRVDNGRMCLALLPDLSGTLHELQAGERLTRTLWFRFANDGKNPCQELAWTQALPVAPETPERVAESGAIPFVPNLGWQFRPKFRELMREALEGPHSFFAKRETIDEYGWRNYGDVWADHEQAYYEGPKPVVSHYNNQYDLLHGFLVQFLLTGDARWWQLADPLARHVMDIDIYHTDRDKSAYAGGMFWHTAHYHDAATSSHRSYSRQMRGKQNSAPGGGPSNEHNYATGLLLYHWLTGDIRAREAVLTLADRVIAMDDGTQHLLGLVCDARTGAASCTRDPDFHGPGRGAGNSINVLLDGWQATGRLHYLEKAEELIRRTIHPRDDVDVRRLLDVENRWSYTVHLQSLARFYALTEGVTSMEACRRYCRASLLHYARWMARHECLYLDHPENLEFPTETWAAQDLRKGNVLLHAALLATDAAERQRFRKRGEEILDGAWRQLMTFETRTCTRPLALVLQQAYIETYLRHVLEQGPDYEAQLNELEFGEPAVFLSQKQQVRAALRTPAGWVRIIMRLPRPRSWWNVWRRSWAAQRLDLLRDPL